MVIEQGGIFVVPYQLWQETLNYTVSYKRVLLRQAMATEVYPNPSPHGRHVNIHCLHYTNILVWAGGKYCEVPSILFFNLEYDFSIKLLAYTVWYSKKN